MIVTSQINFVFLFGGKFQCLLLSSILPFGIFSKVANSSFVKSVTTVSEGVSSHCPLRSLFCRSNWPLKINENLRRRVFRLDEIFCQSFDRFLSVVCGQITAVARCFLVNEAVSYSLLSSELELIQNGDSQVYIMSSVT